MEIILDNIKKPINVGVIIRLACATNSKIYFTGNSIKHTNRKARLSAVGYEEITEIEYVEDFEGLIKKLKSEDKQIIGTSPYAKYLYTEIDYTRPTVFVFGNEATGLSKGKMAMCDETVYIPMDKRVESLNLSTSAAVLLYEVLRQRGFKMGNE